MVNPSQIGFFGVPQVLPICGRPCSWRIRLIFDWKQQYAFRDLEDRLFGGNGKAVVSLQTQLCHCASFGFADPEQSEALAE